MLAKSDPESYVLNELERDKETVWDGVTNPTAVKHLREMKSGDKLLIYHTGSERQVVGTASVLSVDANDPKNPRVVIKVGKRLSKTRTLTDIKEQKIFRDSPLVKQGRLSVVPLTTEQYNWLTNT